MEIKEESDHEEEGLSSPCQGSWFMLNNEIEHGTEAEFYCGIQFSGSSLTSVEAAGNRTCDAPSLEHNMTYSPPSAQLAPNCSALGRDSLCSVVPLCPAPFVTPPVCRLVPYAARLVSSTPNASALDSISSTTVPRDSDNDPVTAAAYLHLLGESLSLIGHYLQETDKLVCVSNSLSVLLDSLLCTLAPLMSLTSQIPELQGVLEHTADSTLENVSYVMPGL